MNDFPFSLLSCPTEKCLLLVRDQVYWAGVQEQLRQVVKNSSSFQPPAGASLQPSPSCALLRRSSAPPPSCSPKQHETYHPVTLIFMPRPHQIQSSISNQETTSKYNENRPLSRTFKWQSLKSYPYLDLHTVHRKFS